MSIYTPNLYNYIQATVDVLLILGQNFLSDLTTDLDKKDLKPVLFFDNMKWFFQFAKDSPFEDTSCIAET